MNMRSNRIPRVALMAVWLSLAAAGPAAAAAGDLDPTFGDGGTVTTNFGPNPDVVRAIALQPDGKVVAVGRSGLAARRFALARYGTDGSLDSTFGGDGEVTTDLTDETEIPSGVAVQANRKIVVAGSTASGGGRMALVRYRSDGTLDGGFGGDGIVMTSFRAGSSGAAEVLIQADGKIVTVGSAGGDRFALARYRTDGRLDPTFGGDGRVTTAFPGAEGLGGSDGTIQTNGKILVAGEAEGIGDGAAFALARYRPNGSLDRGFAGDGRLTTNFQGFDGARGVTVGADGTIVASGTTGEGGGGDPKFALARYTRVGALDPGFSEDGKLTADVGAGADVAYAVVVQGDGRIVAAGGAGENGPNPMFGLARYESDGSPDATFGGDGEVTTDFGDGPNAFDVAYDVVIQPNGNLVAAGGGDGPDARFALARYLGA
jgi:uncharacterized delta-60 repeat protein